MLAPQDPGNAFVSGMLVHYQFLGTSTTHIHWPVVSASPCYSHVMSGIGHLSFQIKSMLHMPLHVCICHTCLPALSHKPDRDLPASCQLLVVHDRNINALTCLCRHKRMCHMRMELADLETGAGSDHACFCVARQEPATFLLPSCRHVRMCHTRAELAALGHGPKLVLATLATLEAGGSRQLLVEWAANPANLLLFPGRAPVRAGTVGRRVFFFQEVMPRRASVERAANLADMLLFPGHAPVRTSLVLLQRRRRRSVRRCRRWR